MPSRAALPSIAEALVNDFAGFGLIAQQRNLLLVSGTGTSKTLPAIARSCIRAGAPRGRFYNGSISSNFSRPRSGSRTYTLTGNNMLG
jgi:hypothetical protein